MPRIAFQPFVVALVSALGLALSALAPAGAQSRFFTFERNVDRPGEDYRSFGSPSASQCSFSCQAENRCRAWTFVRPGIQGPSGQCWLKTTGPRAFRNGCCTSGVRTSGSVRID